ncbi:alpha/beta hydrolase family protein [Rhodohalobacter mucosus]|uniref:Platelet-activating factor acetylhydrolase n=1 Tax=Rhodohalobacter mucosus TaxID=2079485 RepID=A0A316TT24_9BACT|nr:hypothetical protein [Rhodohalobacter mucosus]PWN06781.1 hypothetical protein DDZ15_05775 [Rhodohalobacter mucosus]
MRIFEVALLLTGTVLPYVKRPLLMRIQSGYVLFFLGILILLHLLIEGWRWQMIPAYVLILTVGWSIQVLDVNKPARLSFARVVGFISLTFLIFTGWLLPSVFPVFSLPEPRGIYSVGTEMIHVKTGEEEGITSEPADERELMLKIWYPGESDVSSLKGEKYLDEAGREGFAVKYGLPPSALNYLDYVETYAFADIPVAKDTFPVLIFSHGYGSKATGYYALLTEIASRGYVIVNMNHTFESLGVTFPDGRKEYFDYDYQREISSGSMELVQPIRDAFKNGFDYRERHPIVREAVKDYFEGEIQDRWAEDMILTMDLLEEWNTEGLLKGRLDLNKIGVFGHSVGGGAAGNVAMRDDRVKAAVNLDGIQWGSMIDTTYSIPYLYVSADWPEDHEDINSHIYIHKSSDYFYEAKLLKSGHPDFMDIPFMIPYPSLSGSGDIDPRLGTEIVTNLVTSFFDRHLKNIPEADPQAISEQYDLLDLTVFRGDSINKAR